MEFWNSWALSCPKYFRGRQKFQGWRGGGLLCLQAELAGIWSTTILVFASGDDPTHYRHQAGFDFLKIVPIVWDDTSVLGDAVGEHLVIVRRNGSGMFLGALTDRNFRNIRVKLDVLGPVSWTLKFWIDAPLVALLFWVLDGLPFWFGKRRQKRARLGMRKDMSLLPQETLLWPVCPGRLIGSRCSQVRPDL